MKSQKRCLEREKIVKEMSYAYEKIKAKGLDLDYASYLFFCISGAHLLNEYGPKRFNDIVKEIKEKA